MKKLNLLFLFLSSILFGNNFELTKEEIDYLNSKKIISMCVDPDWEPFEKINKYGFHAYLFFQMVPNQGQRTLK